MSSLAPCGSHLERNALDGTDTQRPDRCADAFRGKLRLLKPEMSRQGMRDMCYPESAGMPITIAMLVSVLLYAIPRTSILGCNSADGYFGGAIATHVRLGQPTFVVDCRWEC